MLADVHGTAGSPGPGGPLQAGERVGNTARLTPPNPTHSCPCSPLNPVRLPLHPLGGARWAHPAVSRGIYPVGSYWLHSFHLLPQAHPPTPSKTRIGLKNARADRGPARGGQGHGDTHLGSRPRCTGCPVGRCARPSPHPRRSDGPRGGRATAGRRAQSRSAPGRLGGHCSERSAVGEDSWLSLGPDP